MMPFARRLVLLFCLLPTWPESLSAAVDKAAVDQAQATARSLSDALLRVMKLAHDAPFDQRFAVLAPVVDQAFDLPLILRISVGADWTTLPAAQQASLQASFRRYTIATYLNSFNSFDGERFDVLPQTRDLGTSLVVPTHIVPRGGNPTSIDYVFRKTGPTWKIVDVLLDGSVSRLALQRSDFRSSVQPGDASRLIARLQQNVASDVR